MWSSVASLKYSCGNRNLQRVQNKKNQQVEIKQVKLSYPSLLIWQREKKLATKDCARTTQKLTHAYQIHISAIRRNQTRKAKQKVPDCGGHPGESKNVSKSDRMGRDINEDCCVLTPERF
ncbi:hypothetical protein RUM44_000577 [Polyplax serrata]|uniref:Uncharacterized protein n=1 Tax=Polyplax serrata TaxID=468196 RepID=A0ABR1B5V6_POLSC